MDPVALTVAIIATCVVGYFVANLLDNLGDGKGALGAIAFILGSLSVVVGIIAFLVFIWLMAARAGT